MRGDHMALDIYLYDCSSDPNELTKTLTSELQLNGEFRDVIDIVNPEILVDGNIDAHNYAYIPEFARYYYITESSIVRTGLTLLRLRSDPLMSFRTQILALDAYGMRTANTSLQTPAIIDPQAPYAADDYVTRYDINTFTESPTYVLVTAG